MKIDLRVGCVVTLEMSESFYSTKYKLRPARPHRNRKRKSEVDNLFRVEILAMDNYVPLLYKHNCIRLPTREN